jgi:hypothetical protein
LLDLLFCLSLSHYALITSVLFLATIVLMIRATLGGIDRQYRLLHIPRKGIHMSCISFIAFGFFVLCITFVLSVFLFTCISFVYSLLIVLYLSPMLPAIRGVCRRGTFPLVRPLCRFDIFCLSASSYLVLSLSCIRWYYMGVNMYLFTLRVYRLVHAFYLCISICFSA